MRVRNQRSTSASPLQVRTVSSGETMRRTVLRGTDLARSQCQSLRLRLLRIGAVVTRSTRTVAVRLSTAYPDQAVFRLLVQRLTAG